LQNPEDVIKAELIPSEQLLWAGRAHAVFLLHAYDYYVIAFGLLLCTIAIFGISTIRDSADPYTAIRIICVIAFFVMGGYILVARLLLEYRQRRRTYYGLSTHRIIIIADFFHREVISINLDTLSDITLKERRNNSWTIIFGPQQLFNVFQCSYDGIWFTKSQFELTSNAREVYETILTARRELIGKK